MSILIMLVPSHSMFLMAMASVESPILPHGMEPPGNISCPFCCNPSRSPASLMFWLNMFILFSAFRSYLAGQFMPFLGFLLLLLSHFRLYVTPQMAAHQAPPSLGFSRQEHWSGLPFPSPMHESEKWKGSRSVLSNSLRPHGLQPTRLLRPWDFPGKSTGVGSPCLLLGFLTEY